MIYYVLFICDDGIIEVDKTYGDIYCSTSYQVKGDADIPINENIGYAIITTDIRII